jgi:hypothetical protein
MANMNLTLAIGFVGQGTPNAIPAYTDNGAFLLGGFPAQADLQTPKFGVVVSENPAGVDGELFCGIPTDYIPVGVLVYEGGVAMNDPAKPDSYLGNQPVAALAFGTVWYGTVTKTAPNAIDPVIGSVVICNNTTGVIEFLPKGSTAPTGWTVLSHAHVKAVALDQNGILVFFKF